MAGASFTTFGRFGRFVVPCVARCDGTAANVGIVRCVVDGIARCVVYTTEKEEKEKKNNKQMIYHSENSIDQSHCLGSLN